jgi:hypothetical protein
MTLKISVLTFVLAVCFIGCSSLTFYSDPAMKGEKVGLKGYYAKPYILVASVLSQKYIDIIF